MKTVVPKKIIKLIQNKEWYHQRFDGAPMFIYPVADAETRLEKRKPKGTEARFRVCYFTSDGKADWYLDQVDINRGAGVLVNLAKNNPNLSQQLLAAWHKDEIIFAKSFYDFEKINLKKLTDSDLVNLFENNYKLFLNRLSSSVIIDHFALGTDEMIAARLRKEIGKINKESEFTNIFSQATAPTRQSFINEAEMELIKLALQKKVSLLELQQYCQKYYWTRNNYYSAKTLSIKGVKQDIKAWQKNRQNTLAKLKLLINTPRKNKLEKAKLYKKYKFTKLTKSLLKISDDFTWWQDERKKSTYQNIHIGSAILNELAKRRNVDAVLLKFLLPIEVRAWFNKKIGTTELKKRQQGCVIVAWAGGHYFVHSNEHKLVKSLMFPQKALDEVNDLRGLSASVGCVIGCVKIINSAREVDKINKGDILVAVMTRPDYIAGIKKAAAVVTNEGGVTCHAAIVSRELGIPCIIGTKIATQVLKDGDMVEVNANHGVVRLLKK